MRHNAPLPFPNRAQHCGNVEMMARYLLNKRWHVACTAKRAVLADIAEIQANLAMNCGLV
jgi:hypothetical protein